MLQNLRKTLVRLLAGEELLKLHRYQLACTEIERWMASHPMSAETAKWIRAHGEGHGPLDPDKFRDRLTNPPKTGIKQMVSGAASFLRKDNKMGNHRHE